MSDLREYLHEVQRRRAAYDEESVSDLAGLFRERDRRPPTMFHDSSFLYLRSYSADEGVRPLPGVTFWLSPDLLVRPVTSTGAYTTTLVAGQTYVLTALLRNRGDLAVPSAKVEFFLTDPTLGFDVRYATRLTRLETVPAAWVPSGGSASVDFRWTVPASESGHKCLFARAFSFSPLELPLDDHALDPRLDRHIAQHNLHIVGQAQPFGFTVVHRPTARLRLLLQALEPEQLLALQHPVLADVTPAREFRREGLLRQAGIDVVESPGDVGLEPEEDSLMLSTHDPEGPDPADVRELEGALREVLHAVAAGRTTMAANRDLVQRYREMNTHTGQSRLTMTTPDLGLGRGEAVALTLTATDDNMPEPEVAGGVTIVLTG
ncbi:hypothetical protein [Ornithinimicrobium sp. W1665]|uniref:hypothetical protein n=1 Tax=Ornithinimicrobium sp. W1665 TaxID=3416666 RepID=UPI003CFAC167